MICDSLKVNTSIEEINFSKNFFGFEKKGIKILSDVLRTNENIKSVNISGTTISLSVILHEENDIKDVGANMIAEMLKVNKTLTHLDLSTVEADFPCCNFCRIRLHGKVFMG